MKTIQEIYQERELKRLKAAQEIERILCKKLELPTIRAGRIALRDEREWKTNEISIEYSWMIKISVSFKGWCWLFVIKLGANKFRDIQNPETLMKGIFTLNGAGELEEFYLKKERIDFTDKVKDVKNVELYDTNNGITLDGVSYEYLLFGFNNEIRFYLNNPVSQNWRIWEKAVYTLGEKLSEESGSKYLTEIFQ